MVQEIGETAGRIWKALKDTNAEMTLAQIKKKVNEPDALVNQALGWLAREGKVEIAKKGKAVKVSLKE